MGLARGRKMFCESWTNALLRVQCRDTRPAGTYQSGLVLIETRERKVKHNKKCLFSVPLSRTQDFFF